jgi:hypothetical protein
MHQWAAPYSQISIGRRTFSVSHNNLIITFPLPNSMIRPSPSIYPRRARRAIITIINPRRPRTSKRNRRVRNIPRKRVLPVFIRNLDRSRQSRPTRRPENRRELARVGAVAGDIRIQANRYNTQGEEQGDAICGP